MNEVSSSNKCNGELCLLDSMLHLRDLTFDKSAAIKHSSVKSIFTWKYLLAQHCMTLKAGGSEILPHDDPSALH